MSDTLKKQKIEIEEMKIENNLITQRLSEIENINTYLMAENNEIAKLNSAYRDTLITNSLKTVDTIMDESIYINEVDKTSLKFHRIYSIRNHINIIIDTINRIVEKAQTP